MSQLQSRPAAPPSVALDRTEVIVLLDSSDSMQEMSAAATTGFDAFIEAQRMVPGEVNVSLVTFDTVPKTVFEGLNIHSVPRPRTTAMA